MYFQISLKSMYIWLKWKKSQYYYNYHYWIYLNMPDCAYINRILNMPWVLTMLKFWIWQSSEYGRVLNMQPRVIILNIPNVPWQSSEYILQNGWICLKRMRIYLNMSEFTIIDKVLNNYHVIHSARSLHKLMSTYWEMASSEPGQRSNNYSF